MSIKNVGVRYGGLPEWSMEDLGMRSILDTKAKTSCVSLVGAPGYRKQLAEMLCRCFILG